MTHRRTPAVVLIIGILFAAPILAQYEEDDQTDDHARQDQRYLERYQQQKEAAATPNAEVDRSQAEAEFLQYVDDLIRDKNYRAANSDHYRVQTDDPRLQPAATAELLERFRLFFDDFWSKRLEMQPYQKQSRVFLFYSFFKYNKLLGADFSRSENRPKGHYGSWFDAVTIHTDADALGDLPDTVVHEAAHQLMDQRFDWHTGQPLWVAEGMASYFGYTFMDRDDGFVAGRVGGKQAGLYRDGKVYRAQQAQFRLSTFRDAMKNATTGDTLYGRLLSTNDPGRFYGQNSGLNYAASWMLVHYLFHGEDGKHAASFAQFLEAEMRGEGGPETLLGLIGMTHDSLDRAVLAHAKSVKTR